jgi:PKD repeat protein
MNLSIQATGTITTYQWYFDNGLGGGYVPVGANSATYSKAFTSTDDGKYYCRVTNTCGWVDSDVATITEGVATTAAISGDVAGCAGSNANFAVTATGSSLSYQWYKGVDPLADDARITGSTSAILNITGMQASDDGIYTCYVSGTCGSTSVDARLTVSSAVSIATNPADRAVCVGGQVSFFVVVTGSNASFQWYKVGTGPIVGATSASYTINPVGVSHAGQYYCVVTNSCGSVTSTQANLTVYENVSIASHPQDVAACSGDNVSFSVTTTGTVLTYQWLFKGTPISDGGGIAGTNTQNLLISNVAKANEGAYSCEVYNGCTTITSNGATLTVSAPISILQHPQSQFACPGSAVNLVAVASGDYITYAWYRNSILQVGYTSSTYSIGSFAVGDAGDYYAVLTNGCGTVQTTTATLTAGVATSVAISGNLTKCEGTDAIFSVTGTGSNLSYQWYRGGTELVDGSDITGSNTATLTVKSIDAADGGTYQCDVSGSCGNYNNLFATLTVQKNVVIEVQPVSTSVVVNNSITLRVVASGEIVGYRWRKNGVDMVDGGHYSGTATANLTISNAENSDQATYTCAIDGVCNDLVSNSATLSVIAAKSITQQPMASVTKCEGETLVLAVEPSTGFTYKWKRGNNELSDDGRISGANSSTLTITNLTTTDQGAYTCVVGTEVSQPSVVTVNPSVYITSNPNDAGKCEGDSHILSVVATGNVLSYQWQKSPDGIAAFTNIAGETGREYSINPLAITHSGFYRCEVTGTCGSLPVTLNSSVAQLSVFDTIVINSQPPANVSVCQNGTTSITFDVSGYKPTFTWTKNGVAITDANITGINTNRIDISNAVPGNAGVYNCIVTSACGSQVISISSTLTVNPTTTITTQPIGRTKCEGDGVVFTVVAEGGSLSYDWQRDGASLGVSTATLSINSLDKATHEGTYRCEVTGACGSATSNSAVLAVNRATAITLPTTPQSQSICQNSSITLAVGATGDNLAYQWYRNGVALTDGGNISGVTLSELNISNALTADAGVYTCTVTGACGSAQASPPITLAVTPTTTITTQPIGRTKCEGDGVVFTVVAEGGSLSYDWQRDGASLGVSTATLSINSLDKATHEGTYRCEVTGACGSATSNSAVLAVNRATAITLPTTPQSQSICQNSSITLAVGATGDNLAYQWYRNGVALTDGGNISGVTLSELNISNALTADAGVYTCTVTGACGSAQASPPITLAVTPTTTITTQPIGRTKCEGDGVVFTVVAEGGSLSYDWQRDGASLGVSTATLSINSLDKATHEGTYRCEVTGACGSATSNSAVLAVNRATAITLPTTPQSQSICQNSSITLAVGATGDNLAYQWYRNGVALTDGGNISGVTLSELNISNALTADAGVYTCTVTGACGSAQASPPITLAVTPTTTITTQPIGRTKCEGDGVVFTVVAEGGSLSYDWQRDGASLGVSTATLSINSLDKATHEGTYRCEVTGACGSATSNSASLIVYELVSITSEPPALTTICQGASTEITVEASGSGLMYQWKRNGVNLSDGGNLSGVTSNKLVISNAVTTDAGFYSCEIVGSCNTVSTQSAELRVIPTTSIALHPVGATLCEGDNVQFIVNAVGASPLTYQWKRDNVNIGANTNTLTLNGITTADAGAYICVVTGATCGSATSNPATLVVNPQITISGQPANIDVCEDNTAIFTVNATGTGTLGYKWLLNNAYLTDNGRVTGSATNQLSVNLASAADEGIYKCEIASTCGSKTSNSVTLAVTDSTQIAIHPLSQTLLQGSAANFSVFATGANLSYQWQKDNVDIPGAQSNAYSITSVLPAHAGQYRCVVRGTCGQVISNMAVLTVTQPVSITTNPLPSTVCAGQSASFTIAATGTVISYQWKFNGNNITDGGVVSGAATANLVISSASSSHSGTYSCVVTGSNNIANSSVATLSVNSVAAITTQPLTQTKCNGDMLVLEVLPNDPTLAYSWELNGSALPADPRITGVNSNLLVITGVSSTDAGSYRCTVSNSCGSELSDPAVVTISPVVSVTNHPSSMVGCEGQTASFTVSSNLPAVNYLWTKNGQPLTNSTRITGVDQANLTIYNISTNDAGYYSCRISDNCSYDNSDVALLEVKKKTTIQSHPVDRVVCRGDIAYFEVNATGTDLGYQWQKNGANIPADVPGYISGSKSNVLIITGVTDTDVGVYRCVITGGCNDELTTPASLTVNEYPSAAGSISGLTTVCQGDGNVLYSIPAIANANTYVWDVPYGASIVGGQGSRAIQVDFAGNALSGVVKVHGLNSCGVGPQSAPLAVTVNTRPTAFAGIDQTVCGYSTTLEANSVAGTWSIRNGDGIFTDSSLFNTNVSNLLIGENTFVWTVTQNGCTSSDEVKITNLKVNINAGNDQIICSRETNLQAIVPATGASWRVINGYGTIESPNLPNSRITGLNQGSNTFAWQVNNQGCFTSDEVVITNNSPLRPEAGEDQIIAFDETDLNADMPEAGTIGYWELLSGGGSFVDATDPKTRIVDLMPGTNILVWTVKREGCTLSDTIIVENILLEPAEAGLSQTLCVDFTTLNAKRPEIGEGQWSVFLGQASFDDIKKPNAKVTSLGRDVNILRWTVRTSTLGVTYDDVIIINNMPTQANAGIDQVLCTNSTSLAANSPAVGTGYWTLNSGAGTIADTSLYNSAITSLGPGKNVLKWTIDYKGCISEDYVTITNSVPTTANAGDDQTICYDSTLLFPNTPTYGVGSWRVETGRGLFNGNSVTNLAPGINTFVYTITNGTCTSVDRVNVINNKPTSPDAGYDQVVCLNSCQLTGNPVTEGNGTWSVINGSGSFSDLTSNTPTVIGLSFGDNIFRWTIENNGCTEHDEVIVSYSFVAATAGLDETLCQDYTQLRASNPSPGTGTWSILEASTAVFDNQNSPNTTVRNLSKGPNNFRWTVINRGCVSYDDVTITNNQPTQAIAGENQAVCSKSASLFANRADFGVGVWSAMSGSASFTDAYDNRTTVNNLNGGPNVLRWTITQGTCVSYDEVIITSNLPVNVFAGNDQVACSDMAVLSANPPTLGTGQWTIISGAGSFDNRTLYNTTVRNLAQGDNYFKWTVSSSDCHVSDTVVIRSSIPTRSIAGADQIICSETTTLGGNTPTNGSGFWTVVSGSVQFVDRTQPNTQATSIARGLNILAWVIDKDGCQSSSEMRITNNLPSTPFAGYDRDLCGDSIRLFANPPTIGTGHWTIVSGDASILSPNQNQTLVKNIKFGPNTFRWTVTHLNCQLFDDVVITSNYAEVNAGVDMEVNEPTVQLIGNKPALGIGTWSLSAGQGTIISPNNFETLVNGLGAGVNIFVWSINYNGCVASDAVTVNYIVWPIPDFDPSTLTGCSPLEVNFVNTTTYGGAPFSWDFGDGSTSNQTNVIHTFQEPGIYNVRLTATAPLGNTVSKEKTITVYGHPTASFDIAPRSVFVPGQHISCYNYSINASVSIWDFGDGTTIEKFAPTYVYTDTGWFDIMLKVINSYGCADSLTIAKAVHVVKRSDFFFPEAFTPNPSASSGGLYDPKDRSNDVFFPIVINGDLTDYELRIYNRTGVLIFKSNDVKIGWDGYYKSKIQPQDVYIYVATGRYNSGEAFRKAGNVLLIRKDR